MKYLHTLDPDELRDLLEQDDLERAFELLKEEERMERYYNRKNGN